MAIVKKSDPAPSAKGARAAAPSQGETAVVTITRGWLMALIAVLIVPWMIAASLYLRDGSGSTEPGTSATSAARVEPASAGAAGPWGRLTVTPIVVSPPLEYVAADWGRTEGAGLWRFPGASREVVEPFLLSVGLSRESVTQLMAAARPDPSIRGLVITPDPQLVRSMDTQVRARLYTQLAKTSLNFDQAHSFRFFGTSPDAWLKGSPISAATRALVEPLIYREGDFLHFADAEFVRSEVRDPEELQRLAKTLLRQSTMLVTLTITDPSEVRGLAEYWGRGGRRTDVRPLLESIAGAGDRSIDVVHLLPTFARNHLYRYPRVTTADYDKPLLANCLWTALNFFGDKPDDRFLDVDTALNSLRQDYHIVEHGFQLGDIVGFVDDEGDLFHVAVHIADGLVYTKNGMSPVAPWTIMPIERLSGYYRGQSNDHRLIYHRRNDF